MNESFSDGARLKLERAKEALTWAGFRLLDISGQRTACIWATRDCDVVRAALRVVGFGELPVKYFEGGAVPDEYKGWPFAEDDPELTSDIVGAMEQAEASGGQPWVVRDEMMSKIRWYGSWAERKVAALKRLFDEHCAAPGRKPANITAATVRHGERAAMGQEKTGADTRNDA
jgi:hypothetical protein